MKTYTKLLLTPFLLLAVGLLIGCASTKETLVPGKTVPGHPDKLAKHYRTPDRRKIYIGPAKVIDGRLVFKAPHMDTCWIAKGFDFTGYDVLYISTTVAGAKKSPEDTVIEQVAGDTLQTHLKEMLDAKGIFVSIAVEEPATKPGVKVLTLTNTIVDFSKGNEVGRYFAGIFGGGQPDLRVHGVATDGNKVVFDYVIHRSGTSFAAFTDTGGRRNEYLQYLDIHSMVLDLTDFIAAIAGKYQPLY